MSQLIHTFAILLTSTAASVLGFNYLIHRQQMSSSNKLDSNGNNVTKLPSSTCDSKHKLTDKNLKSHDDNSYVPIESIDVMTTTTYQQALYYIRQTESKNARIRQRGLSHLAKLNTLSPVYYSIIGQQLDYRSAIQLARTYEANSNLFPIGLPYVLSVRNKKMLATDNIESVNDDDILLHTIRQFLDQLIDDDKRPLDVLSRYYLKLVRHKSRIRRINIPFKHCYPNFIHKDEQN